MGIILGVYYSTWVCQWEINVRFGRTPRLSKVLMAWSFTYGHFICILFICVYIIPLSDIRNVCYIYIVFNYVCRIRCCFYDNYDYFFPKEVSIFTLTIFYLPKTFLWIHYQQVTYCLFILLILLYSYIWFMKIVIYFSSWKSLMLLHFDLRLPWKFQKLGQIK